MTTRKIIIRPKPKEESLFPFYDYLISQIKKENFTDVNDKLWPQISKLDGNNVKVVYCLILHYARLHGNKDQVPYAKKINDGGKGVIYCADNFPNELKLILSRCMKEITSE